MSIGEPARERSTCGAMGGLSAPSRWVVRFAPLVPPGAPVLDLAAGGGRHSRLFLERGHPVVAVDRDVSALLTLRADWPIEVIETDLEDGSPWPLDDRRFGGVVVTNYLWRPLLDRLVAAVGEAGVLIYATFMVGQERIGPPKRADFLLRPRRSGSSTAPRASRRSSPLDALRLLARQRLSLFIEGRAGDGPSCFSRTVAKRFSVAHGRGLLYVRFC